MNIKQKTACIFIFKFILILSVCVHSHRYTYTQVPYSKHICTQNSVLPGSVPSGSDVGCALNHLASMWRSCFKLAVLQITQGCFVLYVCV